MSARVCHQREVVDEDVEEDNTELKELARERAGEPEPSEVMELERERETSGRSSSALALVKLEQTELSSSETAGAAPRRDVKSLSQRVERQGHAVAELSTFICPPSERPFAIRLRLRLRPPRRVRLGNFVSIAAAGCTSFCAMTQVEPETQNSERPAKCLSWRHMFLQNCPPNATIATLYLRGAPRSPQKASLGP